MGAAIAGGLHRDAREFDTDRHPRRMLELLKQVELSTPATRAATWLTQAAVVLPFASAGIDRIFGHDISEMVAIAAPSVGGAQVSRGASRLASEKTRIAEASSVAQTMLIIYMLADMEVGVGTIDDIDAYASYLEAATAADATLREMARKRITQALAVT